MDFWIGKFGRKVNVRQGCYIARFRAVGVKWQALNGRVYHIGTKGLTVLKKFGNAI